MLLAATSRLSKSDYKIVRHFFKSAHFLRRGYFVDTTKSEKNDIGATAKAFGKI